MSVREIAQMTNIDPWFLHQLKEIADVQAKLGSEADRRRAAAARSSAWASPTRAWAKRWR